MPALIPTDHHGTITWLGHQPAPGGADMSIRAEPLARMVLTFAGLASESHAGLTRPSCSRVTAQYPRGTDIRNVRQLCIVSAEELDLIAADLGLPAIDPAWVGASVVVRGIPDLTHLPPSSRLQADSGTTLTVDMENLPCIEPAKTIEQARPGHGRAFKEAAKGRRGVTAWVEREGSLTVGERVRLHVPAQRAWAP
jgi:hypothetical protein